MDSSTEHESMQDAVQAALTDALNEDGGVVVTRWVLAVERFTATGRAVAFLSAPDMQPWEIIGLAEMTSEVTRLMVQTEITDLMYSREDDEEEDED